MAGSTPDLWGSPQLLCTAQGPTHPLGLLREGVWLPCSCLCIPRALLHLHPLETPPPDTLPALPACWQWQCHCPSHSRCSPGPTGAPLTWVSLSLPAPRWLSLFLGSHQRPFSLAVPRVPPAPRLPYQHPLVVPGSPCQRPPCAPGPAGAGAAGRALSPAEKLPNLPFQSAALGTHARKANTDGKPRCGPMPLPPTQRTSCGRGQELCLGGKRSFPRNWELIPTWRRAMTKRQAGGGTLCLLFGQAFPSVYCGAERSKVKGPCSRSNLSHVERQRGKSILALSIRSRELSKSFPHSPPCADLVTYKARK